MKASEMKSKKDEETTRGGNSYYLHRMGVSMYNDKIGSGKTYTPDGKYVVSEYHPIGIYGAFFVTEGIIGELVALGYSNNPVEEIDAIAERLGVPVYVFDILARVIDHKDIDDDMEEMITTLVSMSYAMWFGRAMQHADRDQYSRPYTETINELSESYCIKMDNPTERQVMMDRGLIRHVEDGWYTPSWNFMNNEMKRYGKDGMVML